MLEMSIVSPAVRDSVALRLCNEQPASQFIIHLCQNHKWDGPADRVGGPPLSATRVRRPPIDPQVRPCESRTSEAVRERSRIRLLMRKPTPCGCDGSIRKGETKVGDRSKRTCNQRPSGPGLPTAQTLLCPHHRPDRVCCLVGRL